MSVFNEKGIDYDIEYIDLSNKPDWFLEISPTGKVPVVQTPTGEVLFESAVINEYLDEAHGPQMMPDTPLARAYERMWCDFVGGIYGPAYRINMAKDEATARENIAAAKAKFAQLEEEVTGPLFNGENFGLVDATAAPLFRRLGYVQQLRPDLDVFSGTPKVKAWRDALMSRPSVENSVLPNLFDLFKERAAKTESWILSERTAE